MLTSRDLQEMLHVDRSTIYRMAEAGSLPGVKVGRQWRFSEDAVKEWLGEGKRSEAPTRRVFPSSIKPVIDVIAEMLGVMLVLTDMDGVPVTTVSNPCGLFTAVAGIPGGADECIAGWQELAGTRDLGPRFTGSHLGLECARAFIRTGAELTAMVIAGGVAPDGWPPDPEELAVMAKSLGARPEDLRPHIQEVHRLDQQGKRQVLDMLPRVASVIPEMVAEYHSMRVTLDAIASLTMNKELNA
ncbi:MAG: PocR ligand-binding domain-containing protein [Acidimicrobiia bacterium]